MFSINDKCSSLPKLFSKDLNLTVTDETMAIPGKILSDGTDLMRGHGTYLEDGQLVSSVAGVAHRVNKLLRVKTVRSRFSGEVGDVIIGRICEVQANRWLVDISSTQFAVLLLSSVNLPGGELRRKSHEDQLLMTDYLKVGDLVSAEVQRMYGQGFAGLHTRSMKYGKLGQGILVKVPPALVKRRKAHFFNLPVGASIILGCNGFVWVSIVKSTGDDEADGGGYIQHTDSVGEETRRVMSRLANCVKLLARNFIPLSDTTIIFAYEASLPYEISALIDPRTADQVADDVLSECRLKEVEI